MAKESSTRLNYIVKWGANFVNDISEGMKANNLFLKKTTKLKIETFTMDQASSFTNLGKTIEPFLESISDGEEYFHIYLFFKNN